MSLPKLAWGIVTIAVIAWTGPLELSAQNHEMDSTKSSLTVRVFKSGVFSAFAHDHEIKAPIETGTIDSSANPSVRLQVDAKKLRVVDPGVKQDERAEIQRTMEGPTVLDSERFHDISYQSTSVANTAEGQWEVHGNLDLHGKQQPVTVTVSLQDGHYRGSASLKQSNFGINPIRIAGGTVKVKDEVKIEFDIVPVP